MIENPSNEQGRVGIQLDKPEYILIPGETTTIVLTLWNRSLEDDSFALAVSGIPAAWISASKAVVKLASGEEKQTNLFIQVPTQENIDSGEIESIIRATSQQHPDLFAEVRVILAIQKVIVPFQIAIEMESTHFSVAPGGSTTFQLQLTNEGHVTETLRLVIDGIPTGWVSTPFPILNLGSQETQEIPVTITPPWASESRAGRHPLTIRVVSQEYPDQAIRQDGILTIGTYVQFQSELQPVTPLEALQNAQIKVTNQGNIHEAFKITWQSQEDLLAFEIMERDGEDIVFEEVQEHDLRVMPGKEGTVAFRAGLRKRPWIGNRQSYPFQVHVRSSEYETLMHTGEVNDRGVIPIWAIPLAMVLCLIFASFGILIYNWQQEDQPVVYQDDSWVRVEQAGVLRVATSADYPPFSYYTDDFMLDGFDVALIREIGSRLGVQVEIVDHAFDGLGATLQVGQVDVVIAALSVTPEREEQVDFSNIYYVGKDGILAGADLNIQEISSPEQMAGRRIGVQRSSVYETWAQIALVSSNLIMQDQLFVYSKPEHAIEDLRNGHLDLVILDYQPAIKALEGGGLKLVGQGLNQQRYAVAFPKGANTLRSKINETLLSMQNQGRVNQLAEYYLGLGPGDIIVPPTPVPTSDIPSTPLPTATKDPTPPPCVDAMEFIDDLNYPDEDLDNLPLVDPGTAIQKGWRIRNSGTCTWSNAYMIKYIDGSDPAAQMGGQPTAILGEVQPSATYDLYVDLVAPITADKYVGYWQMHNSENVAFGQTIWVAVEVRNNDHGAPSATATPEITQTPTE